MRIRRECVALLVALLGCSGGGGSASSDPTDTIEVSISPTTVTVAAGVKVQFTATVTGDTSDASVAWSASAGSVDQGGLFTAPTKAGIVHVTATSNASRGRAATATVTVMPFAVTPGAVTAHAGGAPVSFSATLNGAAQDATWTLSAPVGSLSASTGSSVTYTPPLELASGTVVTLTATADGSTATSTITLTPPVTLMISPEASTVTAGGGPTSLIATVTHSTDEVSWAITPSVGALSATSGGAVTYTPPATVSAPTDVVVTATVSGVSAMASLTVVPAPSLTVSPETTSLAAGGADTTFSAVLENASDMIAWSLSPSLGTLSATTGATVTYTPPSDLASTTVVTVKASAAGKTATAQITVVPPPKLLNLPYTARNGMTATLTSLTRVDTGSYYTYTANYTQTNNTSARLDEGQLKLYFTNRDSLPQYGFFNTLMPGQSLSRSYSFNVLYLETPSVLEYDGDNFFSSTPIPGSLQWLVANVTGG